MPMIESTHDHRHERARRLRENRQAEPDESVGAHLQENSRQNHRPGSRRVGVGVRQPGVEREHRNLDREPEEEREEDPPLQVERQVQPVELRDVERVHAGHGVVVEVQRQDAQQHDDAADQGVEEELDRGVEPIRAAPDADEEVHRHQHHFPEQEEEQEVERHERAEHPGLQDEQEDVVLLQALGDRGPRRQDRDEAHQRREQDQQDAEAVDAEKVLGPNRGNPWSALDQLKLRALRVVEAREPQRNRDDEADKRRDIRNPLDGLLVLLVHEEQKERARQRREQDD